MSVTPSNDCGSGSLEDLCHVIAARLRELAVARAGGAISEAEFVEKVLAIETAEVQPHGLTLVASHTRDDWTVFKIKITGSPEVCAAFEFLPETGEFRRVGSQNCG